jgi:hypothetical protein
VRSLSDTVVRIAFGGFFVSACFLSGEGPGLVSAGWRVRRVRPRPTMSSCCALSAISCGLCVCEAVEEIAETRRRFDVRGVWDSSIHRAMSGRVFCAAEACRSSKTARPASCLSVVGVEITIIMCVRWALAVQRRCVRTCGV